MAKDWTGSIARNIQDYQGYSIGKLIKQMSNPDMISLAAGLPSPETFPRQMMEKAGRELFTTDFDRIMNYSAVDGEPGLKDAIIAFLAEDGIDIDPENLLITTSAQQGLDLTGRMLCDPGHVIILERPTFAGAICSFDMQRPRYIGLPMEEDGADIDHLRQVLKNPASGGQRPKFIYIVPDFQNPAGITLSLAKRRSLVEISHEFGILIVEDSPYRSLRFSGEDIPSLYSLDQQAGGNHVIGIYTFSKLFCPGMRVGFNIGPAPLVAMMTNLKEGSTLCTPKYNQDMCTAFLTDPDRVEQNRRTADFYRTKAEAFLAAMERHFPADSGVSWTRPEGGMFVWATVPEELDTLKLFHRGINHGVAFVPGNAFFGENPSSNQMRLNFSFPPIDRLDEGVRRLAQCVRTELEA